MLRVVLHTQPAALALIASVAVAAGLSKGAGQLISNEVCVVAVTPFPYIVDTPHPRSSMSLHGITQNNLLQWMVNVCSSA